MNCDTKIQSLNTILLEIEKGAKEDINVSSLSQKHYISESHLRSLFRNVLKQPIAGYIRSRKLSASLNDLLNTKANVLDIALDYGYEHEQSYIRAFKREYGITPGDLRKSEHSVKEKPPIHLLNEKVVG